MNSINSAGGCPNPSGGIPNSTSSCPSGAGSRPTSAGGGRKTGVNCELTENKRSKSTCIDSSNEQKKSCRPGKLTRNPFFNFLRIYRQQNCHLKTIEVARQGALKWNQTNEAPSFKISGKIP